MKKIIIYLCIFYCVFASAQVGTANASNETYYAKIESTGIYLCSAKSESTALFELPYSYFVQVEASEGDFYRVRYKNTAGFVKKDKLKLCTGTPSQPFAQRSFNLIVQNYLYESPNNSSSRIATVTEADPLSFYGTILGQKLGNQTSTWIFCELQTSAGRKCGYVFSGITDFEYDLPVNQETLQLANVNSLSSSSEFKQLSTGTKIILIVAISIPSVMILYFLIKPSKILELSQNRKRAKKEHRKIHHGDYFEFDEADL